MAYIRRRDRKKIPQRYLQDPERESLILRIKRGCNENVKKIAKKKGIPLFNRKGKREY